MSNRAEQFLAFDALKGLKEALREKEKIKVDKKDVSDEDSYTINQTLTKIKKYMIAKVLYFREDEYIQVEGIVSKIDKVYKKIVIVKEEINFNDIISISIIE